jgi:hypothetical protein
MPEPSARVIADSISEQGYRLTTVEAVCWRPVLAEQNTHRSLSRNSASSRAIPIQKNLDRFIKDFMYPAEWGAERPGMQPGPSLDGDDLWYAELLWDDIAGTVASRIRAYLHEHPLRDDDGKDIPGATRLHKSLLNRWLEVGLSQTQIITGTSWDGYFWQRCHHAADPNIRLMAEAIRDAMDKSEPVLLRPGEWHLPYFGENGGFDDDHVHVLEKLMKDADAAEDRGRFEALRLHRKKHPAFIEAAKQISAGRCARVSLLNQSGKRDIEDDLRLYVRLADRSDDPKDPPHASPLEHIATPWADNAQMVTMPNGKVMGPLPKLGNLTGWWQMRHEELMF